MTGATQQTQVATPELSEAERRRRLASVYRLLIQLDQRGNSVGKEGETEAGSASEQGKPEP
jgi:hypothetical protein